MRRLCILLMGWLTTLTAIAAPVDTLPPLAKQYMPVMRAEIQAHWSDMPLRSYLAALVEQETCVSLKSKGCWNPRTELKTDREYGFGLGQITVTKRFNVFEESKASDVSLRNWQWNDRFNPQLQIRALVIKVRNEFTIIRKWGATPMDGLAFTDSAYNGGRGSVSKDRLLCSNTKGCDPTRWFGNVELTSFKSKTKVTGYGQSFFDINRGHVKNTINLLPRRQKYVAFMDS